MTEQYKQEAERMLMGIDRARLDALSTPVDNYAVTLRENRQKADAAAIESLARFLAEHDAKLLEAEAANIASNVIVPEFYQGVHYSVEILNSDATQIRKENNL